MEHHLEITRRVRHYVLEPRPARPREVWLVCHGYGQLARYFVRHFAPLQHPDRLVVAPEAPHRFYLEGFSGRVGASWMTREDRQTDIADNNAYLDVLYRHLLPDGPGGVRLIVLGFSQGGATVARWLARGTVPFHRLVLWASVFPPDVDPALTPGVFAEPVQLVVGTEDAFVTPEVLRDQQAHLRRVGVPFTLRTFSGGHHLDADTLRTLAADL